jgi:hypothetical protein
MTLPTTLRASSKRSEMPVPLRERSLRRLKPMGNRELPTAPERPRENRRERAARRPPDTPARSPDGVATEALRARLIDAGQRHEVSGSLIDWSRRRAVFLNNRPLALWVKKEPGLEYVYREW